MIPGHAAPGPGDPSYIGPYRLIARLGAGGMGRVYLARSEGGRTVAVKLVHADFALHPVFRRRFAREVAAARKVGGEWTAPVLDADTEAKTPWVATGYVAGPSLNTVVGGNFGPLPSTSVHVLAHRLALALQAIHEAGLVHRDLKPANILLTVDGPRVIDFGLARGYTASLGGSLTEPGAVLGTPAFMSPEQVRGETLSRVSDVFSLGSVLTYAATGRLPFPGEGAGVHSVMFHIAYEEPNLDGVPDGLADLVRQCLAKEPEQRPSVRELIDRTRHAVARSWLPGELVARLGRDAARLLDAEVHLAESDPVPAVSVPPHATTFPDVRGFDADGSGGKRDVLDLPEAGIRPPSVRRVEKPRRRPWLRIATPSAVLAVVGALFLAPSPLLDLGGAHDEKDPLAGRWEGQGSLPDGPAYAEMHLDSRLSEGDSVGFVVHHDRLTCQGSSEVLSRQADTLVLGRSRVHAVLPAQGDRARCTPFGRQTLSLTGDDGLAWTWSAAEFTLTGALYGNSRIPVAYPGTWDSGQGHHLTIQHGNANTSRISGLDVRGGRYCVWSARIYQLSALGAPQLVYGPVEVDREVSDPACQYWDTYELTMSRDGTALARRAWPQDTRDKGIPHTVERLHRVE
ncbi:serine/threonine-protein kinase [Streptomyces sp. Lzd4kr]|nr:serine/threonine-protein kinase [Streptomyces sp. Lzd4kr]